MSGSSRVPSIQALQRTIVELSERVNNLLLFKEVTAERFESVVFRVERLIERLDNQKVEANCIEPFDVVKRKHMLKALVKTNGNQLKAAKLLGMSRRKLAYQMRKHGIPTANGGGLK